MSSLSTRLQSRGLEYEILSTIKKTKEKEIYLALRREKTWSLCQEVILKCYKEDSPEYRLEFESLQKNSPYCVRLLTFESFSNKQAFVLESIQGVSLLKLLEFFSLSNMEIASLVGQIYLGLMDLKSRGLCHGDLSLNNVLLDISGRIKFVDFGAGNYKHHIKGTPPFVAPEILKGSRSNFFSDLFSLGVIEVFLNSPHEFSLLKEKKVEYFLSKNTSLLKKDPKERRYDLAEEDSLSLKSLGFKVKELLACEKKNRLQTRELKPKTKKASLWQFGLTLFLFLSSSSTQSLSENNSFLQIQTHRWHWIQIQDIKRYAPFELALKPGSYTLKWKNHKGQGQKRISLKQGEILSLKDGDMQ